MVQYNIIIVVNNFVFSLYFVLYEYVCVLYPTDIYVNTLYCAIVSCTNHSDKQRIWEFLSIHSLKIISYTNSELIFVRGMINLILEQHIHVLSIFLPVHFERVLKSEFLNIPEKHLFKGKCIFHS